MKRLSLFLFFIFVFLANKAATLSGKITDTKGEALPFAIVFVKGTTIGTSANAQGIFQLSLQAGNYIVVCQQMGFKQTEFSVTILGNEILTHNFKMEEQQVAMKEFVVKSSDDPAKYIMRKVIAKRKFYEKFIKTFETDIYLKGAFKTRHTPSKVFGQKVDVDEMGLDSNKQGFLYLCEEMATYFSNGKQRKTLIHSVKESGSPNGLGFSQFPPVVNVYQNIIRISPQLNPRGFISPVNDNAFYYYKFKLLGDFTEEGRTIYKIKVIPKRLYEPLFDGVIYVVDADWSLHSLSLTTTKKSNMEILDTFRLGQTYLPLDKDNWVIKQQVLDFTLKIFGFDIYGYMTTVYNEQKVNEPIPDSVFSDKMISVYDKTANKKDSSYWKATRPIPLQAEESRDYVKQDSLRIVFENPKRLDSIRRKDNRFKPTTLLMNGYSFSGKKDKYSIRTNSLLTGLLNYNTVEGMVIAPRFWYNFTIDSIRRIYSTIALRYGLNNEHTNIIARVTYSCNDKYLRNKGWNMGIEGGKYVFQFNSMNPVEPLFNSITTLFDRNNFMKIYERWQTSIFAGRNYGNGFRMAASISFQQRLPLENTTDFSFAKTGKGGFTDNLPAEFSSIGFEQHNALLMRFRVYYKPGITYTQYPDYKIANGSRWPTFSLFYQKGIPDVLNSNVDYDKWSFSVKDEISMKVLGSLNYHFTTGGFINTKALSIPDMNHVLGNQYTVASSYLESFQLAPYYRFSNAENWFAEAHAEWHLNGFITNKIPLFRQMRWYAVAGCNLLYFNQDNNYSEAFVGIDNFGYNKFRMFRIDFVQSFDATQHLNSAIRIGLHFTGISVSLADGGHDSEW
jgi:hypothetical protein